MTLNPIPDRLITTYLEMSAPAQFRPAYLDTLPLNVQRAVYTDPAAYRELYASVGETWHWRDRLIMPDDDLIAALSKADISILTVNGEVGGYIELAHDGRGDYEVAYFGLRPQFFGRGLGKHLLSYGVQRAWDSGAKRIWLHTCNLDGPAALANYMARGFTVTHVEDEPMPARYK